MRETLQGYRIYYNSTITTNLQPESLSPPPGENNILYYSPEVASITNFALDFWRLKKRVEKLRDQVGEEGFKPVEYSLESCSRSLSEQGIEIREYNNQEYKTSLNVDVVTYENGNTQDGEALIKETVEPAIIFAGKVVKKAKVIVITPISN